MMIHPKIFLVLLLGIALVGAASLTQVYAQGEAAAPTVSKELGLIAIGAGIAIGLPGLGAALGLGTATAAIAAAGAEKPELIMKFFIYIVFIEAIAIYGLIIGVFNVMILPTL